MAGGMDPGRLQAYIAVIALAAGLITGWMSLNSRVSTIERVVEGLEASIADDRRVVTGEMIEMIKELHALRGRVEIATDSRGSR